MAAALPSFAYRLRVETEGMVGSLGHIFPMLGEVGTTADVLAKLAAR